MHLANLFSKLSLRLKLRAELLKAGLHCVRGSRELQSRGDQTCNKLQSCSQLAILCHPARHGPLDQW